MRERIQQFLAIGNRANWCVFAIFAIFIFGKTLLFDHFAFRELALQPSFVGILSKTFVKVAAALLFASFTFLLRDKRWLILLSFIIDTWFIANLIYMRNNHILLDAEAFNMSSNLHGYFWSVLIYIEWGIDLLFYALTILFCLVYRYTTKSVRNWRAWIIVVFVSVAFRLSGEAIYVSEHKTSFDCLPFVRERRELVYGMHFPTTVANTSVLYSPAYILSDYFLMINGIQPKRPLADRDVQMMTMLDNGQPTDTLQSPLIIILLESLENWVLTPQIMPNLYRLTQNDHVFYANRIHTQIVGAPSADGQLIVNTGLLPINAGGTCLYYGKHTYPAVMSLAPASTVCLLPHDLRVWNQTEMSPAYGYDTTICYSDIDTMLFQKLNALVDEGKQYIQCITQSTHAPFVSEELSHLPLPEDMPWVMYNFIRAFNALDDGLGYFVRKLESDPVLQQYTIVITADHRILHYEKRRQMQQYADAHDMNLQPMDDCLPLLIYSPKIQGNPRYTDDAFQMDIYPTYMSLLGVKNYRWKGLGIDLLENPTRPIQESEAYILSDKLIRNNYFSK
jgi:phosphoglycerol transferase MdoB-like AlkP superfamily enzyme